jgi:hypothetical protein
MFVLFQATYLSPDEHREAMQRAGFVDVVLDTIPARGWIAVVGTKNG